MLQLERNFATLIEPILKHGVSCVGLINRNGRLDQIVGRDDLPFSKDKIEMFCMSIRLSSSMQSDFNTELQPVYYNVTERRDMKIVSIPVGERIIFSLMGKKKNHIQVVKKLRSIFNNPEIFSYPLEIDPVFARSMENQ